MGVVVSVNQSRKKGVPKHPVERGILVANFGLKGDAHAGAGRRQVSLLMIESIEAQRRAAHRGDQSHGPTIALSPGAYAENITTQGIDLLELAVGDELRIGSSARLRVTRIGKECHTRCAIFRRIGDCVMPREGIFCEVLEGGTIVAGDTIERSERRPSR